MRISTSRRIIIFGMCCVLILLGSIWYANAFNGGRLVAPMDFSTSISLILALTLFLSEYLLYRYDHDEQSEE